MATGDDPNALKTSKKRQAITLLDFLAEITMSILQKQRQKNPELGYARDFVPMLMDVLQTFWKTNNLNY